MIEKDAEAVGKRLVELATQAIDEDDYDYPGLLCFPRRRKTMEELLDKALERVKASMFDYTGPEDYNYFLPGPTTATVARLRLDWELAEDTAKNSTAEEVANFMAEQAKIDLADLIVNGDVENISDPLLKVMDGSEKRGQQPANIDIFKSQVFKEYKSKKKTVEYTWFCLLAVQWA